MFIQLTEVSSEIKIRININLMTSYYKYKDYSTRVRLVHKTSHEVEETPEEIDNMIENTINSVHDKAIEVLEIQRKILNERRDYGN